MSSLWAKQTNRRKKKDHGTATKIVNHHAPGDAVVLAIAVAALQTSQPHLKIQISSNANDLFKLNWETTGDKRNGFNPQVKFKPTSDAGISYPVQMTQALSQCLDEPIPFTFNPPIFKLTDKETQPQFNHPYLIINSGRKKSDGDCKFWGTHNWQQVVNGLKDHVHLIQIGTKNDVHPKLDGTINYIGKTDHRQLLSLISHQHCLGVLSQITFAYWLAVAQDKRTWTICNAREHPDFLKISDNSRFYFAEKGTYDCELSSCFKIRTHKHNDGNWRDKSLCESPKRIGLEVLPACALAIDPQQIIQDVLNDLKHK